ncbi:MAG: succinylglutamate desuccinylase/aspartoacylase family protein [Myxococcota bacterium]
MDTPGVGWTEIAHGAWRGGTSDAPALGIVGGVHGDEQVGARVIESWRDAPSPEACGWELSVILGNPRALEVKARFIDFDLNRAFGPEASPHGYEAERAAAICAVLGEPVVCLDVHQTHCETPPLAVVRNTPAHLAFARALGLHVAVVDAGRIYGATMLADWVDAQGGLGLTLESGRADSEEAEVAARSVVNRLVHRDWDPGATIRVYAVRAVLRAPWADFNFTRELGNGSPVRANEVLAERSGAVLRAPADGVVLLPHADVAEGAPAAVFAEDRGQVAVDHRAWQERLR